MILFLLTILLQLNNSLIGKWELISPGQNQNKGFVEFTEFKKDTVVFTQEFISKNSYEIKNDSLKVINNKNEKIPKGWQTIIESRFKINQDTLILSKDNLKEKDKMIRISSSQMEHPSWKNNKINGTWFGKTNKGVKTYFTFKNDNSVIYRAVIDTKKYKFINNNNSLKIFLKKEPVNINYVIRGEFLILNYEDSRESFKYKRIKK